MRLALLTFCLLAAAAPAALAGSLRSDVVAALKHKKSREAALELERALAKADSASAAKLVVDLVLTREHPEMVHEIGAEALASMQAEGVTAVVTKVAREGDLIERVRAIEVLGRADRADTDWELMQLSSDPSPVIRTAVTSALALRLQPDDKETFEGWLRDPSPTVRSVVAGALARIGKPSSVPLLCDALMREEGRLIDDLTEALAASSGHAYGPRPDRYLQWFAKKTGRTMEIPDWTAPPPSFESPLFRTRSRRILFMLSVGQTMREEHGRSAPEAALLEGVAAVDPELARDLLEAKTKLDVAKAHLRVMLRTLADGVEFDVLVYSTSPTLIFGDLTKADRNTRKRAETRVKGLSASSEGDLDGALLRAFDPRSKDPFTAQDGPDTIVLLSDGNLAEPGSKDRLEVQLAAGRWNQVRQIRFLVAAVGVADTSLMASLGGPIPRAKVVTIP